jgi:transcriptional regulator with XRE-family HTH domain
MFTPAQLRAARALAGWSREELAEKSETSAETVKRFELQGSDPKRSTLIKWRAALSQAGVEFTDPSEDGKGEGVRFRSAKGKR